MSARSRPGSRPESGASGRSDVRREPDEAEEAAEEAADEHEVYDEDDGEPLYPPTHHDAVERPQTASQPRSIATPLEFQDGFVDEGEEADLRRRLREDDADIDPYRRQLSQASTRQSRPGTAASARSGSGSVGRRSHRGRARGRAPVGEVNVPGVGKLNLHDACQQDRWPVAQRVLAMGRALGLFDVDTVNEKGFTPLYLAAFAGAEEAVAGLLAEGADPNIPGPGGATPLHVAILAPKNSVVIELLLDAGADPDIMAEDGASVVYVAALRGKSRYLKQLLVSGDGDVNFQKVGGATALYAAAFMNHIDCVKVLVKNGAFVELCKEGGFSPLYAAAEQNHEKMVSVLLKAGAPQDPAENGATPLFIACSSGHTNIVRRLIAWPKTDLDVAAVPGGITPLYICAELNRVGSLLALLAGDGSRSATIDKPTRFGAQAIHVAAEMGHTAVVVHLLRLGANPVVPIRGNRKWVTPVWMAAQNNHTSTLIELIWDLDAAGRAGRTERRPTTQFGKLPDDAGDDPPPRRVSRRRLEKPLFVACRKGYLEVVELLLRAGANVDSIREDTRATPIATAAHHGHRDIVMVLVENGADPDKPDKQGVSPLMHAVQTGDADLVKFLLGVGADAYARRPGDNRQPIHLAAELGFPEVITQLLAADAQANSQDASGITPLILAIVNGHLSTAEVLLDARADATLGDRHGFSPLYAAAQAGDAELVHRLLTSRGVVDNPGEHSNRPFALDGTTPVHIAARHGATGVVELLLSPAGGGKPNGACDSGETILMAATVGGFRHCVRLLLEAGANPAGLTPDEKYTALHLAADKGHADIAKDLIAAGAPKNVTSHNGQLCPLTMAIIAEHTDVALVLLDAGCDPTVRDSTGVSPLYMAAQRRNGEVVSALLRMPVVIDGVDWMRRDDGSTALLAAAQVGATDIVSSLLQVGADASRPNKAGVTPLYVASQEGHATIIRHLLAFGANPSTAFDDDYPPLFAAALGGHVKAVRALLDGGADVDQTTKTGAVPMHAACSEGHMAVALELIKAGAKPDVRAGDDRTPLEIATKMGHFRFASKLKPLLRTMKLEADLKAAEERQKFLLSQMSSGDDSDGGKKGKKKKKKKKKKKAKKKEPAPEAEEGE